MGLVIEDYRLGLLCNVSFSSEAVGRAWGDSAGTLSSAWHLCVRQNHQQWGFIHLSKTKLFQRDS